MTKKEFIFTKKFPQRLNRHIAFWGIYYVFSLLTYFHPFFGKTSFESWVVVEIKEVFWHVITQMIFCYTVLYFLLPKYLNRKKYVAFGFLTLILSVTIYGLSYVEQFYFFSRIHADAHIPFLTPQLLAWYCFICFISYYPISTGLAMAFKMLKNFYIKQSENQLLTRENANAELQLLKAQVHPHFLFNTLNNIYSFSLNNNIQAPKLVKNLSDTLQYMITDCDAAMVPLSKEIKMIYDYIDLEKIRYGNRLNMQIEISGNIENKLIVPLLMIPFIENSFKHGPSRMIGDVWITLFLQADETMLHFTLTNSKPSEDVAKAKGGIGLNNVKKRLDLLYPSGHLMVIEPSLNTYTVNMQIPLHNISGNEYTLEQTNLTNTLNT